MALARLIDPRTPRRRKARHPIRSPLASAVPLVLFDIGGVLIRFRDELTYRAVADRYGLDRVRTAEILRGLREPLQSGQLTLHQFWSAFAGRVGCPMPNDWPSLWSQELARAARPQPPVFALAADLRRHGVRTGVFSNTDPSHWRFFRSMGWFKEFRPAIASFQIGAVKPASAAFRIAAARLPRESSVPIFVDDNLANVRAAKRVGWEAIRFTSTPDLRVRLIARGLLGEDRRGP